ncbi:MAG: hypothetical protein IKI84_09065 [Clostridia bacterium]|nr:hypothetical protein [Clostridia bacterium]
MMKKTILCLVALILMLCSASVWAASGDEALITDILRQAGITEPVQLSQWGDTAACFAGTDSVKRLVLLERHDGAWQIVIDNPTALIQDADWPELYLDSDISIYWTYILSDQEVLRYHSSRGPDDVWGPVDQYYGDSGYGEHTYSWITMWDDAHGGEIIRGLYVSDENDNTELVKTEYLPAAWLSGDIRLSDFDLRVFPTLVDPQFGAWFENDRFFVEASAVLMPGCSYIKGILKDGALHFLVRDLNTCEKHYVIVEYASRRKVNLIVSTPLPENTALGYENFTDSLWIDGRCVTVQMLYSGKAGLEYIYDDGAQAEGSGGFLFFGDRTVWDGSAVPLQTILYGDHPWDDITQINWNTLPHNLSEASARMDSGNYAMVVNPDPSDRLHLRERADKRSRSQGKYYTGTAVGVMAQDGDWTQVTFGDRSSWVRGYMMKRYLAFGQSGSALRLDLSAMPQLSPAHPILKVYRQPQAGSYVTHWQENHGSMRVIGIIGDEWYHVWFPATGEYGFVRQTDLAAGNG